jgi:hypothetical protein
MMKLTLLLWLALVGTAQCLTVHSVVQPSTGSIVSFPAGDVSYSTLLYENCRLKLPAGGVMRNVTLVSLNYSMVEFTYGNPPNFPQRIQNGTDLQAIVFDANSLEAPTFYEDAIQSVANRGFDALIIRGTGDETWNSLSALRFWRNRNCAVPTFIMPNQSGNLSLIFHYDDAGDYLVADLDFRANAMVTLINSTAYILGVSIPAYVLAIMIGVISVLKLYRSGFPYIRNTGTYLCCLGCVLCVLICKSFP